MSIDLLFLTEPNPQMENNLNIISVRIDQIKNDIFIPEARCHLGIVVLFDGVKNKENSLWNVHQLLVISQIEMAL